MDVQGSTELTREDVYNLAKYLFSRKGLIEKNDDSWKNHLVSFRNTEEWSYEFVEFELKSAIIKAIEGFKRLNGREPKNYNLSIKVTPLDNKKSNELEAGIEIAYNLS